MAEEPTTSILIEIRDGIRLTNERLDATRTELSERLDQTNQRLDQVVREQIGHATAIVDLEKGQREMVDAVVQVKDELRGLNQRLDNVLIGPLGTMTRENREQIDELRRRVEAIEQRTG